MVDVAELNKIWKKALKHDDRGQSRHAISGFLHFWDRLKEALPSVPFNLETAAEALPGLEDPLQDCLHYIEEVLSQAAEEEPAYRADRVRFCEEALQHLVMKNEHAHFSRSYAEGLAQCGRLAEAEAVIAALLQQDSNDEWTWATWGDMYAESDKDRARKIYLQGKAQLGLRDEGVLDEWLGMLDPETDTEDFVPIVEKPPHMQAVSTKVGRNEPCPCGSGKKSKKCCGA